MKRPVFVVGCPRSGTTLLYFMLMAAGGFAGRRQETCSEVVSRRDAKLHRAAANERFRRALLAGHTGRVRGLDLAPLLARALAHCSLVNGVQPQLLEAMSASRGMGRWLEATPHYLLHMAEIARVVPDALFVHVIRDGRDCAISAAQQGVGPALPREDKTGVQAAAVYWEWMVRAGRSYGAAHPETYREVRFEKLVADPRSELSELGAFLDHDLAYDRLLQHPVQALAGPDTWFGSEWVSQFRLVSQWRNPRCADAVRRCEEVIGAYLRLLGYPLSDDGHTGPARGAARIKRSVYLTYFSGRHWLKGSSPSGPFRGRGATSSSAAVTSPTSPGWTLVSQASRDRD